MFFHSNKSGKRILKNEKYEGEQDGGSDYRNVKRIIEFLAIVRLRKTKKTGFEAIGKKNIKERHNRINLRKRIGAGGVEEAKAQEADAKIQETGQYAGSAVPQCLSR
jgi:hypothetical protein